MKWYIMIKKIVVKNTKIVVFFALIKCLNCKFIIGKTYLSTNKFFDHIKEKFFKLSLISSVPVLASHI